MPQTPLAGPAPQGGAGHADEPDDGENLGLDVGGKNLHLEDDFFRRGLSMEVLAIEDRMEQERESRTADPPPLRSRAAMLTICLGCAAVTAVIAIGQIRKSRLQANESQPQVTEPATTAATPDPKPAAPVTAPAVPTPASIATAQDPCAETSELTPDCPTVHSEPVALSADAGTTAATTALPTEIDTPTNVRREPPESSVDRARAETVDTTVEPISDNDAGARPATEMPEPPIARDADPLGSASETVLPPLDQHPQIQIAPENPTATTPSNTNAQIDAATSAQ